MTSSDGSTIHTQALALVKLLRLPNHSVLQFTGPILSLCVVRACCLPACLSGRHTRSNMHLESNALQSEN